jgi:hypothetical protein
MKSTLLNSKRVGLTLATLAVLLTIVWLLKPTSVIVQSLALLTPMFVTLTTTMGISWSESFLNKAADMVEDIAHATSNDKPTVGGTDGPPRSDS